MNEQIILLPKRGKYAAMRADDGEIVGVGYDDWRKLVDTLMQFYDYRLDDFSLWYLFPSMYRLEFDDLYLYLDLAGKAITGWLDEVRKQQKETGAAEVELSDKIAGEDGLISVHILYSKNFYWRPQITFRTDNYERTFEWPGDPVRTNESAVLALANLIAYRNSPVSLDEWVEQHASRHWLNVLALRRVDGIVEAKIDGRGWFAPRWKVVPRYVFISQKEFEALEVSR